MTDTTVSGVTGVHFVFTGWSSGDTGGYSGAVVSQSITMNNPITEAASWNTEYFITANANGHGNLTTASQWIPAGNDFTVSVTNPEAAGSGHQWSLTGLMVDSSSQMVDSSVAFTNVQAPHSVVFFWTEQFYITVDSGGHGNPSQSSCWVNQGTEFSTSVTSPADVVSGERQWITSQPTLNIADVESAQTLSYSWTEQFYLTVSSAHDNPCGQGWYNAGATATAGLCCRYGFWRCWYSVRLY